MAKDLVDAGHGYMVQPLSACAAEVESRRLRWAPLREPALSHQLVSAVTAQLELPRGFATRVGEVIREEVRLLVDDGTWTARLPSADRGA